MRILVVDDDPAIRILMESKLKAWRHTVSTAGNGRDAWRMLEKEQVDVVISDWSMPEMDGLELCRLIRGGQSPTYQYVILCTGKSERADFLAGMDAGADDFMTKPIDSVDLQVRLRAAQRILDANAELALSNAIMKRDREAGSHIQRQLLPTGGQIHPRVKTAAFFVPSLDLAGDMYNCFTAGPRYVIFYQLDVSGHGIPSALMSFYLSRLLVAESGSPILKPNSSPAALDLLPPAQVVQALNRRFQDEDDLYFTMLYGYVDTETLEARLCQAGHPAPFRLTAEGKASVLGAGGFPVGLWPGIDYEETRVQLESGDRLILYSDGITDCQNQAGEAYSIERFETALKTRSASSLNALVEGLQEDISSWRGSPEFLDDISLLALEFRGTSSVKLILSLSIESLLEQVSEVRASVLAVFERLRVPQNDCYLLQMAVSEIVSNTIEHGYKSEPGHGVDVNVLASPSGRLIVEVLDDAPAAPAQELNRFLSTVAGTLDPDEAWPERGHGLFLVRQVMDSLDFSRRENRNLVTAVKQFPALATLE